MRLRTSVSVIAAVTLLVGSAGAHHNMSALFDFNDRVTLTGTLTRIDWRNPHIYVFVDARPAPSRRRPRRGRSKARRPASSAPAKSTSVDIEAAIGKAVTAEVSRARDGSNFGPAPRHDAAGRQGGVGLSAKLLSQRTDSRGVRHEARLARRLGRGGCPAAPRRSPRPSSRGTRLSGRRVIAQILEANARQLTVFDRHGQAVGVVGPRDLYNQPVCLAGRQAHGRQSRPDLDKETNDLWVIDVATARATQITTSKSREGANSPAWSPDGGQLAYVALREGYFGLYRKASNGQGPEELLFKNSAPMTLTDWSQDGRYLTYFSTDLSGGGSVRAADQCDGRAASRSRSSGASSRLQGPRLSPDNRFMSFVSNSSGRNEVYVVPFDPAAAAGAQRRHAAADLGSGRHGHGVLAP